VITDNVGTGIIPKNSQNTAPPNFTSFDAGMWDFGPKLLILLVFAICSPFLRILTNTLPDGFGLNVKVTTCTVQVRRLYLVAQFVQQIEQIGPTDW